MTDQIFIFTAGNAAAKEHLATTIQNAIPIETVLKYFGEEEHTLIKSIADEHGLYAWGAVPGQQNTLRWEALEPKAWMLCVYGNRYHYVSRVIAKYRNQEFARQVWGTDPNGSTWELMYFLTRPIKIDIPVASVAGLLNNSYMGFTRIIEDWPAPDFTYR